MPAARSVLQAALSGGRPERPLFAPLACAVAAEIEGLAPQAFLRNATKLANTLRDLQRGLGVDVVVAESGSLLELEALGASLDWSAWPPAVAAQPTGDIPPADLARRGRMPVLTDALARLRSMLPGGVAVAVALQGPQRLATLAEVPLSTAAALVLATVRLVCTQGVDLVWLLEDGPVLPTSPDQWSELAAPIWGTIRFFRAVPSLHLAGAADGWLPVLGASSAAVPCFDPELSPQIASAVSGQGAYGLIVRPDTSPAALAPYLGGHCLLLTSPADWAGVVAARDLQGTAASVRRMIT